MQVLHVPLILRGNEIESMFVAQRLL